MEHAANDNGGRGVQIFAAGDIASQYVPPASLARGIEMAAESGDPRGSILTLRFRTAEPRPFPSMAGASIGCWCAS